MTGIKSKHQTDLARCRQQIETKLGWGDSQGWSTQDFDRLSEEIAAHTGVALSVTTLKRVWGRVRYSSAPTQTTLNALAVFAGYESWRAWQQVPPEPPMGVEVPSAPVGRPTVSPTRRRRPWLLAVGVGAALVMVVLFFQNHTASRVLSPDDFAFSSEPVTQGIPNSVLFRYDATASPTDSVFIQQSWDPTRRQQVPKNGHEHTSVYYLPGYFRAKLVVGGQIVREHDLFIPSDGWVVVAEQEPVPVYFKSSEVIRDGALSVSAAALQRKNIPLQPLLPKVIYRNILTSLGLSNDNFTFETRLKVDYAEGSAACQQVRILLFCRNDMFIFPLSAKGCVGTLGLFLAGHSATSAHADLSALGRDLSQWVAVRYEVVNKRVRIWLDDELAYDTTFPNDPTDLLGAGFSFEGTGSVDYVRFRKPDGAVVYADEFETL
ncbi:hypothetical protein GCM10027275_41540 [Rhabdobacter roseus]|uniref:Uncharacterized protein n=1 Tax=Rhabdobacter roseus TaxID=1655419 RepID=A0A840TQK6_9BACT|nr:hypothetical protein [Rhabdobacter roseus]MBB5286131.1 hypothetical protein [Rhabdobacter roseus]